MTSLRTLPRPDVTGTVPSGFFMRRPEVTRTGQDSWLIRCDVQEGSAGGAACVCVCVCVVYVCCPWVRGLGSIGTHLQHENQRGINSDFVYRTSLVPIKMCSDCETCGLLNHCK